MTFHKPAAPAVQMVNPVGQPVAGPEVKALSNVGSMAADSLRSRINQINQGYIELQDSERKALDLNAEWNLDLPHNQMIHQPPQPAAAATPPAAGKK